MANKADDEVLWTARDVAALYQVSAGTIRNWSSQKKLPSLKVNGALRFRPSVLREWLRQREFLERSPRLTGRAASTPDVRNVDTEEAHIRPSSDPIPL